MARRLAQFPGESLYEMVNRTLLSAFLPPTTRSELGALLEESGIVPGPVWVSRVSQSGFSLSNLFLLLMLNVN